MNLLGERHDSGEERKTGARKVVFGPSGGRSAEDLEDPPATVKVGEEAGKTNDLLRGSAGPSPLIAR